MSKVRLFGHSLLWVFTVSISVLAVLIVAARFFLAEVPIYKNELEAYLAEEIGGEVHISALSAKMSGFTPQLSLTGITLDELDNQTNTLSIGEIRLSFNPFGFVAGQFKPNKMSIVDTNIKVKRFSDGHLSIVGLSTGEKDDSSSGDFSWLLEGEHFEVIDSQITWQDEFRGLPDMTFKKANITIQNKNQEHALKVTATLPKETGGGSFSLLIKVTGDALSTSDWNAKGYFKAQGINIEQYLTRLKIDNLSIDEGEGDIELWSTWNSARLSNVNGSVLVRKARLLKPNAELNISNFSGYFAWEKVLDGWYLDARDVAFKTKKTTQGKSQFSVQYRSDKDDISSVFVAANGANLEAVSDILKYSNLLDKPFQQLLDELEVKGHLNEASALVNRDGDRISWAGCGQLEGFFSQSYKAWPAINNFSGTGCSTEDKGWLDLNMNKGAVNFSPLFRNPIIVEELDGLLTWTHDNKGWSIRSNHIKLNSPHISTQTRVNLMLGKGERAPFIDLQTNFGNANSQHAPLYLPVGIMGKELVKWLDQAFVEGEVNSGGMLLKGSLSDFPFRKKEGVFQVLFDTDNIRLHYQDKWPDVIGIAAKVEFKNEGMNIVGHKGEVASNEINRVVADVADFETDHYLHLSGKVDDDLSGLYAFFKQSPISKEVSTLLNHSSVSGPSEVDLNIDIPLRKKLETKVHAIARLRGNALGLPSLGLAINNIVGVVEYDKRGLSGKSIKGSVLGEKLDIDIKAEKNNTVIEGKGYLNIERIAKKYPSDVWKYINGRSKATIKVELPRSGLAKSSSSAVTLKSDLNGIAVDLPEPVGKLKNSRVPFEVSMILGEQSLPIKASYGAGLNTYFQLTENSSKNFELDRADIHFGKTAAMLPKQPGIQLSGIMDELNILEWKNKFAVEGVSSSSSPLVNQLNLRVKKLKWLETTFDNIYVIGEHSKSTWVGEVSSPIITGRYEIPDSLDGDNKISLDLESLRLPPVGEQINSNKKLPVNPTDFPNIDINSKELLIGESQLGKLRLQLRQKSKGVVIQLLSLKSARDDFNAKGTWEVNDGQSLTGLNGKLSSKSLGSLLKDTELTSKLKGAPVEVNFDLNWPGEPQNFSKEHLSGYGDIKSGKGRLLDVEPGVGRIFGLLSLSTLQRRLQFDFSDLVQKGLSFDKVKGRFTMLDGKAETNRFYLESPSSRLDFQGNVNLADETLDQLITVTPKTTESLPLAGAIAGGPLVGAAVYIAQKIAGKTVNKLSGYQFRATGPWSDPKIKQISQPGGKIFGLVGNVLTPIYDATVGQLPFEEQGVTAPAELTDDDE
jgi:uncharacterized protein (TIGR02099 family)